MVSVRKGLAEPGQTVILPLLVLKEFKYVTFVANGAVNKPVNDPERETTGTFGVGIGRALRRTYAAMIEVRSESTFDFQRDGLVTARHRRGAKAAAQRVEQPTVVVRQFPEHRAAQILGGDVLAFEAHRLRILVTDPLFRDSIVEPRHFRHI